MEHILQIAFKDVVPEAWGEIQLYTAGGILATTLAGWTTVYRSDGQPCKYYSAADMQLIVKKAMWYVSYHTTYCNALNIWISGAQTAEEIQQIFYGADVPEQYQSEVLKAYLLQIAAMAGDDVDAQTT